MSHSKSLSSPHPLLLPKILPPNSLKRKAGLNPTKTLHRKRGIGLLLTCPTVFPRNRPAWLPFYVWVL